MASEPVVRAAEAFVKLIVTHYGEPNLTVEQIRSAALSAKAEPLDVFSLACRKELRMILKRGELSATIGS
jgi:predicted methyltransferase